MQGGFILLVALKAIHVNELPSRLIIEDVQKDSIIIVIPLRCSIIWMIMPFDYN